MNVETLPACLKQRKQHEMTNKNNTPRGTRRQCSAILRFVGSTLRYILEGYSWKKGGGASKTCLKSLMIVDG